MSYEGTADPRSIEQRAMDAAARLADLVVVVSAGNKANNTALGHGAVNRLAVGSVHADTRVVAAFSARGPLSGDKDRDYPTLVANGVMMTMPAADAEVANRLASGGSYAAPQVAGAALLYRSVKPTAGALETRAAIVATTEDVGGKNRRPPFDTRNAFGLGYLRDDRLVAAAQGKLGVLAATSTLTPATNVRRFQYKTVAGRYYAVAVTWDRFLTAQSQWSNVDVAVLSGTRQVATQSLRDNHEKVVFRAATSSARITVLARSLEVQSLPFALVAVEALPPFVRGGSTAFGRGCATFAGLTPVLGTIGSAEIGSSHVLDLSRCDPLAPVALSLGLSRRLWGNLSLPFDLTALGAPGCAIWASRDILLGAVTNSYGAARVRLGVPNDKALIDGAVFHQALLPSPRTNLLGLVLSNAIEVRIGGDPN